MTHRLEGANCLQPNCLQPGPAIPEIGRKPEGVDTCSLSTGYPATFAGAYAAASPAASTVALTMASKPMQELIIK